MADSTIAELPVASSLNTTDLLVIWQAGATKRIPVATALSKLPSTISVVEPATVVASGVIPLTSLTSKVSASLQADVAYTLAAGTHGLMKEIVSGVVDDTFKARVTITGAGFSSIDFTAVGQSVTLKFITDAWYVMSSHGVTINA